MIQRYPVYRYMTQTERQQFSNKNNIPLEQQYAGNVPLWRTADYRAWHELTKNQQQEINDGAKFLIEC